MSRKPDPDVAESEPGPDAGTVQGIGLAPRDVRKARESVERLEN